jgi:hypothetical protein
VLPLQNQSRPDLSTNKSPLFPERGCVADADGKSRSCAVDAELNTAPRPVAELPRTAGPFPTVDASMDGCEEPGVDVILARTAVVPPGNEARHRISVVVVQHLSIEDAPG